MRYRLLSRMSPSLRTNNGQILGSAKRQQPKLASDGIIEGLFAYCSTEGDCNAIPSCALAVSLNLFRERKAVPPCEL